MTSDDKVGLKMAARSIVESADLLTQERHADSIAQARIAVGLLYEFMRAIHLRSTTPRRSYENKRYAKAKVSGQCTRCTQPAKENRTMCEHHILEHRAKAAKERRK